MTLSFATNAVTVNGQTAYRKGEYFRKELPIANSSAVSTNITVAATGQDSVTGSMLVPKAAESFWHDLDGNLLSDSLWTNRWNAENRLVQVESALGVPSEARMREVWAHLPDGRWIERIVSTNNGSAYYPAFTNRFVWDGQVLMAILDHTNGLVMSFMRGLDLSGSIQGAGGVGGVLAVNFATSTLNPQPSTHFLSYDGNGNVVTLTDASTGTNSGHFEYGPFSEPIRVTGTAAQSMPLRFSTMYEDSITGDRKYLFRDLIPSAGRWKSRDPIKEKGGLNLYGICRQDVINGTDILGLYIELWYGNHPVKITLGVSRHSKLWLVTDEWDLASTKKYKFLPALSKTVPKPKGFVGPTCIWFVSMGAGPIREELIAEFNRPNDAELLLDNPSLVASFEGAESALAFLDEVDGMNSTMNQNFLNTTLEYEGAPDPSYIAWDQWDEFNSNSYISGLLTTLLVDPPYPGKGVSVPGYGKPVPFFVFRQSFPTTDALRAEWRRYYPGLE